MYIYMCVFSVVFYKGGGGRGVERGNICIYLYMGQVSGPDMGRGFLTQVDDFSKESSSQSSISTVLFSGNLISSRGPYSQCWPKPWLR